MVFFSSSHYKKASELYLVYKLTSRTVHTCVTVLKKTRHLIHIFMHLVHSCANQKYLKL